MTRRHPRRTARRRFWGRRSRARRRATPHEVIVVEDGHRGRRRGALLGDVRAAPAAARRPLARAQRGRRGGAHAVVAFLDADDRLRCRTARAPAGRRSRPRRDAAMCYGPVTVVDEGGEPHAEWNDVLAPRFAELVARGSTFDAVARRRRPALPLGDDDPARRVPRGRRLRPELRRATRISTSTCGSRATARSCRRSASPVALYRVHGTNTPSDALYRGHTRRDARSTSPARAARRGARCSSGASMRSGRWASFPPRAAEAARAALAEPRLLRHPRFVKRLLGLAAPTRVLERAMKAAR